MMTNMQNNFFLKTWRGEILLPVLNTHYDRGEVKGDMDGPRLSEKETGYLFLYRLFLYWKNKMMMMNSK